MTEHTSSRSRKPLILGVSLGFFFVALIAVAVAYAVHYSARALPNVTVAGQSVSGMTRDEIVSMVDERAAGMKVNLKVEGHSTELALADMGMTVDSQGSAEQALAPNKSILERFKALAVHHDVPAAVTVDDVKLRDLSNKVASSLGTPVVDASVHPAEDQESFVATSSQAGRGVAYEELRSALGEAARTLRGGDLELTASNLSPVVDDHTAQGIAESANKLAQIPVAISDGEDVIEADAKARVGWVKISAAENGTLNEPTIDDERVREWVRTQGESTNREPVNGRHNVNSAGDIVQTPKKAVDGRKVKDLDALSASVIESLKANREFKGEFSYDTTPATYERKLIADGAEKLVYQAAPGEKWLEINLGNNSVTAYEGATVVHGPVAIVPGSPGHETVTGLYNVYLKYQAQDMGCTPDWPYCAKGVPWVTYWTGSYAFHGAPWQHSFGWSGPGGSHGCINMPVDEARWVYQWSEIGTPVMSHY